MKRMLMMVVVMVFAIASVAGGAELPPGKWWNNPQIAQRLELEPEQQTRQRLAGQLTQARGRLFERELMMLVDMRGVLNDEQWSRLRAHIDRRQGERDMQQQRRGQPRPRRRL